MQTVLAIAKNRKSAIRLVMKDQKVSKGYKYTVTVKAVSKNYPKGIVIL
jgi:hypothetical protein